MARRGLLRAAQRLAGDDVEAVCRTFDQWRKRSQRELPWLAGPAFSALNAIGVAPPAGEDVRVLERFLLGAETDPVRVRTAIVACSTEALPAPQPPDARGALVDAVERFFVELGETYSELHHAIRDGHRRYADDTVAARRPALDDAAATIEERTLVLRGMAHVQPPPPRKVRDHGALAVVFAALALLTAAVVVWMVLQGWPMQPVPFDL